MAQDFSVDHAALDTSAKQLNQAANDLDAIRGKLQNPPGYSADQYGDYGAADAAKNFVSAWQDEMQVNVQALHELAGKLQQSASNYRGAEHAVAASFGRAAA